MNVNKELLQKIGSGEVSFVSKDDGLPLVQAKLIEVNPSITDPNDANKAACRITAEGTAYLASGGNGNGAAASTGGYTILKGVALPEAKKRGNTSGSGAPSKYPFATMEVNDTFFSADTEHAKGNALKGLGSTVSANNDKYSEPTGEMKTVTRAVRDPATKKAKLDENGKKVTETVQLPVKKYNRKFTIRAVEAGKTYGNWTAPANGAIVARTV